MKLLTFRLGEVRKVGLILDGSVLDLPKAYRLAYDAYETPDFLYDMRKLIAVGRPALEVVERLSREAPEEAKLDVREIAWEPPRPEPREDPRCGRQIQVTRQGDGPRAAAEALPPPQAPQRPGGARVARG